jgi:hypothetical protein
MREIHVQDWAIRLGDDVPVPVQTTRGLETLLLAWRDAYIRHAHTHWQGLDDYGIPSPVVRVDLAPQEEMGTPVSRLVYEIEARPAGLGILLAYGDADLPSWNACLSHCAGFAVGTDSPIKDDVLAAEALGKPHRVMDLTKERPETKGWWVRSAVADERLEACSLVPVREDGDKRHLVSMGLAVPADPAKIDWEEPFVVKPVQGTWCRDVLVFMPPRLRRQLQAFLPKDQRTSVDDGFDTRGKIEKKIAQAPFLAQPFHAPERVELDGRWGWRIWRLYFGWHADNGHSAYRFLGGIWTWRPNIKVHGARDAILGFLRLAA